MKSVVIALLVSLVLALWAPRLLWRFFIRTPPVGAVVDFEDAR